jgi:hypothetical protein
MPSRGQIRVPNTKLYIFLTVHLCIILVSDKLDAQFLQQYVYLNSLHVSSNSVLIFKSTIIPDVVLIQLSSWGWAQSGSKHVEDSNKHIIEKNCAPSWSLTRITKYKLSCTIHYFIIPVKMYSWDVSFTNLAWLTAFKLYFVKTFDNFGLFYLMKTVKLIYTDKNNELTLRLLMSHIYGAPILDVSRSHTTTQHIR